MSGFGFVQGASQNEPPGSQALASMRVLGYPRWRLQPHQPALERHNRREQSRRAFLEQRESDRTQVVFATLALLNPQEPALAVHALGAGARDRPLGSPRAPPRAPADGRSSLYRRALGRCHGGSRRDLPERGARRARSIQTPKTCRGVALTRCAAMQPGTTIVLRSSESSAVRPGRFVRIQKETVPAAILSLPCSRPPDRVP